MRVCCFGLTCTKLLQRDIFCKQDMKLDGNQELLQLQLEKPQGLCMAITMAIGVLFCTQLFWQKYLWQTSLFLIQYTRLITIMHDVSTLIGFHQALIVSNWLRPIKLEMPRIIVITCVYGIKNNKVVYISFCQNTWAWKSGPITPVIVIHFLS